MVWFRAEQGLREIGGKINPSDPIAIKIQGIFEQIGILQDEFFRELVLYIDYYQYQQRNGIAKSEILIKVLVLNINFSECEKNIIAENS